MQVGRGIVNVVQVRHVELPGAVVGLLRADIVHLAVGEIRWWMAGEAAVRHAHLAAVVGIGALVDGFAAPLRRSERRIERAEAVGR